MSPIKTTLIIPFSIIVYIKSIYFKNSLPTRKCYIFVQNMWIKFAKYYESKSQAQVCIRWPKFTCVDLNIQNRLRERERERERERREREGEKREERGEREREREAQRERREREREAQREKIRKRKKNRESEKQSHNAHVNDHTY